MPPRRAVLQTPPKSSVPHRLPFYKRCPPPTRSKSTLLQLLIRLHFNSPRINTYKKPGGGSLLPTPKFYNSSLLVYPERCGRGPCLPRSLVARHSSLATVPVTPFSATLTGHSQLTENPPTLSPAVATLTRRVKHKSFACHSYKKHRGWGYILGQSLLASPNVRDAVGSFCSAVDSFDQCNAASALDAVAGGSAVLLNGCKKVFEDGLVPAEISDGGGRRALVFVFGGCGESREVRGYSCGGWSALEIGGDDAVVLEDHRAFRTGDFDTPGVVGVRGGGGVKNAESATGEFERGDGGVFGFDFVQQSSSAGLHANDITKEPE